MRGLRGSYVRLPLLLLLRIQFVIGEAGVPLATWLGGLKIELPALSKSAPIDIDGGSCWGISFTGFQVIDTRAVGGAGAAGAAGLPPGLPEAPVPTLLGIRVLGLSVTCGLVADSSSLYVNFTLAGGYASLDVAIQPLFPPTVPVPLPLGPITVTSCSVNFRLTNLAFAAPAGSESVWQSALDSVHEAIEKFVTQEAPKVACSLVAPALESEGMAALAATASKVAVALAPPVTAAAASPPLSTVASAPQGNSQRLVDWGTYPPLQLGRALFAARPEPVAALLARLPRLQVPIEQLPVNRSATLSTASGGTVGVQLRNVAVDGLRSYVQASLGIVGAESMLDASAAFRDVVVEAELQLEVFGLGPNAVAAAPLLERVSLALHLGNLRSGVRLRAMADEQYLDELKIDQLQHLECLATCAKRAIPAVGESPLGVHRVLGLNATPSLTIAAPGGAESTVSSAANTVFQVLLSGYAADLEPVLLAAASAKLGNLDGPMMEILDSFGPCAHSGVYFGPGDTVDNMAVYVALAIGFLGLILGIVASFLMPPPAIDWDEARSGSLYWHPAVPRGVAVAFPLFLVSTLVFQLMADVGLGTVVNIVFKAGDLTTTIGPAFSFSLLTATRDAWRGGAYCVSILAGGLSGIWPIMKLLGLFSAWLLPPVVFGGIQRRGSFLEFLDDYGKYSLVDSWMAVMAIASYNLGWSDGSGTSIKVDPVPLLPFFIFVIATVLSLLLGHVACEYQRRSKSATSSTLEVEDGVSAGEESSGTRPRPLVEVSRGNSRKMLALLALTGAAIVIGSTVPAFAVHTSGAAADLLMDPADLIVEFSLFTLAGSLTQSESSSTWGPRAVQIIFLVFAFVIPLLVVFSLMALLVVPCSTRTQRGALKLCHVLNAWAAFDVFAIAVVVACMEFGLVCKFLVYNDNIARMCRAIKGTLGVDCMALAFTLELGSVCLFVAAVASACVPRRALHMAEEALEASVAAKGFTGFALQEILEDDDGTSEDNELSSKDSFSSGPAPLPALPKPVLDFFGLAKSHVSSTAQGW